MTYAKKLSHIGEALLAPHLPSIKALKPNTSYRVEGPESGLSSFRYYLYTWIDVNGLIGVYRVRKRGEGALEVEKIGIPELRGRSVDPLTNIEEFVIEQLSELDQDDEVRARLEQAELSGEIRGEDVGEIWKEWKRVCGG